MTTVTVLGLGQMGVPIARRLLATGHHVTVWNRTPARAAEFADVADSPAKAVHDAEVVVVMVTDAAAVDAVLFGPSGAAGSLRPDAIVLQLSTIAPAEIRAVADRLPAVLDAPVAGSVGAAESGTLTLLVGGDDAIIDRAAPVLDALGTVRRCGPVGAGSALKLVLNTALVTGVAALADCLTVADSVGVDRATALDALAGSALGGAVARSTGPGGAFSLALAGKDAGLALREVGTAAVRVARAAAEVLREHPDRSADISTLVKDAR
jgi:3-hydroxyisobutyrate dehydrogenase-like beta-hydroxyacid dehydrogenase